MAYCNLDKVIYEGLGEYDIPEIEPFKGKVDVKGWLSFNYCKQLEYCTENTGCFFYIDDYQFETLWNHPNKYIENLRKCGAVISPDFSVYTDFPKAIQIYNVYRNLWLTKFYQDRGVKMIPNVTWSISEDENDYLWELNCYPKNSVIAVSIIGGLKFKETFIKNYDRMLEILKPSKILIFSMSDNPCELKGNVEYIRIRRFKKG